MREPQQPQAHHEHPHGDHTHADHQHEEHHHADGGHSHGKSASSSGLISLSSLLDPPPSQKKALDIQALREKLASGKGPQFWRTLEEAAESEDLVEYVEQEFPGLSGQIPQGVDRRKILKVMAASLAMAGAAACTKQPKELIVPYVRQPENVIPGLPLFYATAMPIGGYARGVLVESHLSRPTKVEGNPDHPASLGATGIFEQASILNLYDPDRSENVRHLGRTSTWGEFTAAFSTESQALETRRGEGLAILTGITTSPSLMAQVNSLRDKWPSAKWYVHEPAVNPATSSAAKTIAGRSAWVQYDLSQADVIVSLDSDLLNEGPASLYYARQFARKRNVDYGKTPSRLYAIESIPTVSGSLADHHFPVPSSDIPAISYHLAKACGASVPDTGNAAPPKWLPIVAQDLQSAKGRCVVLPGEFQPEGVHLAAYAANVALGNIGKTVRLMPSLEPENTHSIEELANDLNGGRVEVLVTLSSNPVYSAPASLKFEEAIRKARLVVALANFFDETSQFSHWHIPEAHYLETWSDCRAFDGLVTIQQPLVEPLYGGRSAQEVVAILQGQPEASSHQLVKAFWENEIKNDFERVWQTSLHDGFVAGTAVAPLPSTNAAPSVPALAAPLSGDTEVVMRPDPTIGDGTWANNSWLQELPKPQTKLTWENAVTVSPERAAKMGISTGDVLRVTVNGAKIEAPAWILPGQAEKTVGVTFGYGRVSCGHVGNDIGYSAYRLQDASTRFFTAGTVVKTGGHVFMADTQGTQTMADREPVRAGDFAEYKRHPDFATDTQETAPIPASDTLYPTDAWKYEGYKWGMSIDLNVCTGCSACIIACQAENNIAVVGKEQVAKGRHMHWIRVDRYYSGNLDSPEIYNQPVPCMHCENAPCEIVCPVGATVHSNEGINQMVYNRCVGTRYCSNNCPYKVRRFNFYLYQNWSDQSLFGMRNPDVTVRSRGVMEKCSYCIQRIQEQKIAADKDGRLVRDGDVLTACQQVCPTDAIIFGNLNEKNSRVAKLQRLPRNYRLLDDLNNRPRTTYLSYVRNTNEALRGPRGNKES